MSSLWRRQWLPSPWISCTCTSRWAPACGTRFFQVSSIITTTGYATVDFNTWPTFSKAILVALMFIGGCAGSTAGGIKVARVVILQKVSVSEMRRMLHPNAVPAIQFEGKP